MWEPNPNTDHEFADEARKTLEQLTEFSDRLLEDLGLSGENDWETALLHEKGQAALESGDYATAREAESKVLSQNPNFLSAHNNLSLVDWFEGNPEAAIATAQAVLEDHPDNIHALSNLVRFFVYSRR
jgi:tetratricopeptide (TPR) repeat protein